MFQKKVVVENTHTLAHTHCMFKKNRRNLQPNAICKFRLDLGLGEGAIIEEIKCRLIVNEIIELKFKRYVLRLITVLQLCKEVPYFLGDVSWSFRSEESPCPWFTFHERILLGPRVASTSSVLRSSGWLMSPGCVTVTLYCLLPLFYGRVSLVSIDVWCESLHTLCPLLSVILFPLTHTLLSMTFFIPSTF